MNTRAYIRKDETPNSVDLISDVQILLPEETFTPIVFRGRVRQISLRGARVEIFNMTPKRYAEISREGVPRYLRIVCKFPTEPSAARVPGVIVRGTYDPAVSPTTCEFGVHFEDIPVQERRKLKLYLDRLRRSVRVAA